MLDWLAELDTALYYLFNGTLISPQLDVILPYLTEIDHWRIPIAVLLVSMLIFGGKKGRIYTLLILITLTLTDQTSSHLIKPLVARIRPCNALEGVRLLVGGSRAFSFPSSHAANMFGAAVLFTSYYRPLWPLYFLLAALVAYSRIYVGLHYPFDAIGGALLGAGCATIVLYSKTLLSETYNRITHKKDAHELVNPPT